MADSREQHLWRRIAALTAILLCEGLLLGVVFHLATPRLALPPGWWTGVLAYLHYLMPLGAVFGAALFLVAGGRIWRIILAQPPGPPNRLNAWLAVQVIVYAAFYVLTAAVFRPIAAVFEHPGCWVGAWLAGAGLILLLWAAALLPPRTIAAIFAGAWDAMIGAVLVGLAAWGMGLWTQPYWWQMQNATLTGATAILRVIDPTAHSDPPTWIIGAGDFNARVSAECSGYEGIGLEIVFLSTYLWLFRRRLRFPQALILLPAATACVWLANMVRIALLVFIGANFSPAIAVGGFHSYAGIVLFLGVSIATILLAEHSSFFSKEETSPAVARRNPAAAWLVPLLAAVAVKVITGLFSADGGFDPFYPLSAAAAAAAVLWYRREYPPMRFGSPILACAVGTGVFVVWIAWAGGVHRTGLPIAGAAFSGPFFGLWVVCRCLGFVVVTPIIEELAFRGYLARRLMSADFESVPFRSLSLAAIGGSAVLFAALHGAFWPAGLAAGIAFAAVARRAGSLGDAILAHTVANGLLALTALATGAWGLFS